MYRSNSARVVRRGGTRGKGVHQSYRCRYALAEQLHPWLSDDRHVAFLDRNNDGMVASTKVVYESDPVVRSGVS